MKKVLVCANYRANPNQPSCAARGSKGIVQHLQTEISKRNMAIPVEPSECMSFCEQGPNVRLVPGGPFFHRLTLEDIPQVLIEIEKFCQD